MRLDYDLNIYQLELGETELDEDTGEEVPVYSKEWYAQVYVVNEAGGYDTATEPITLTSEEIASLKLGTGYFDEPDCWYGLSGFVVAYKDKISDRLWSVFNALPTRQENK